MLRITKVVPAIVLSGLVCLAAAGESPLADGPYREYYPNDKVRMEGTVANGLRTGTWTFYAPTGEVLSKIEFKDGKRVLPLAQTVRDDKLGFTITFPPGFERLPESSLPKAYSHGYMYIDPEDETKRLEVTIEPLSGELSKNSASTEDVSALVPDWWLKGMVEEFRNTTARGGVDLLWAEPEVRLFHGNWKAFRVTGFVCKIKNDQVTIVMRAVQVPLRGKAIQLIVIGAEPLEKDIETIMTGLLASLDGEGAYKKQGFSPYALGRLTGFALMAVVGFLVLRYLYRRFRGGEIQLPPF